MNSTNWESFNICNDGYVFNSMWDNSFKTGNPVCTVKYDGDVEKTGWINLLYLQCTPLMTYECR